MNQECELSIITINYNGLEDTCQMLSSLSLGDISAQVIVVDNGSSEDEGSVIQSHFPWVEVYSTHNNLGFAGGNNVGISRAQGKYIFFVNNDTILSQCNLRSMINRMDRDESVGGLSPLIQFYQYPRAIQYAGYTKLSRITLRNHSIGYGETELSPYLHEHDTPYLHGAAMLVRRDVIEQSGLMPECYFLYYEELDWSVSIRRQGYRLLFFPTSVVFHKESQSTGSDSPLKLYYITRNRFLFSKRNSSFIFHLATCLFLLAVVIPRLSIQLLCQRRFVHLRYVYMAIGDFFVGNYFQMKK